MCLAPIKVTAPSRSLDPLRWTRCVTQSSRSRCLRRTQGPVPQQLRWAQATRCHPGDAAFANVKISHLKKKDLLNQGLLQPHVWKTFPCFRPCSKILRYIIDSSHLDKPSQHFLSGPTFFHQLKSLNRCSLLADTTTRDQSPNNTPFRSLPSPRHHERIALRSDQRSPEARRDHRATSQRPPRTT